MLAPEAGTLDRFYCDIYVQDEPTRDAKTSSQPHVLKDVDELHMWNARLFAFISARTKGFIWNRESLVISVNNRGKVPCLSGQMVHGDAVDDEWLAVWLLREASRKFSGLVISVRDADGEFLLAEAAMHIPHWLTPENSSNRVFIYKGRLHIVPLSTKDSGKEGLGSDVISLNTALSAVLGDDVVTLASDAADAAAFERLKEYPERIKQSLHRARCVLPSAIAKVLSWQPQLVAAAVEMFYGHDVAQIKTCVRNRSFPQEPSSTTTVMFNRVQYAKIVSQSLPAIADYKLPPSQSPAFKGSVLGMKLGADKELSDFMQRLSQVGYFSNPADVSRLDSEQYRRAVAYFETCKSHDTGKKGPVESFAKCAGWSFAEAIAETESTCLNSDPNASDDDDSWLSLHPDELDELMRKASSVLADAPQDDLGLRTEGINEQDTAQSLQGMLDRFESFLVADSGAGGAEFEGDNSDRDDNCESSDEDVDLDANEIIDALMKAIGGMEHTSKSEMSHDTEINKRNSGDNTAENKKHEHEDNQAFDTNLSLEAVMDAMDSELGGSKIGQSFVRSSGSKNTAKDEKHEADDIVDVDVDLNLVENIVESFRAQEGLPGPAGTMLGQFGIHLPRIDDDESENRVAHGDHSDNSKK
ncbi:hypothetical protein IWW48_001294 [Coemansia sp. RSA 1200]|nr:hypothetical protein IWW48_001294 [Coemansia sp. RSA 1200]